MRGDRDGRNGGRRSVRPAIVALALAALLPVQAAQAQDFDGPRGYDRGPPPGYAGEGYDPGYRGPPPRRGAREPVGLNCAAVQEGISGPQPYSCPLPGPRPIGVRCFCNLPIASFSPPQTAVGHVVR